MNKNSLRKQGAFSFQTRAIPCAAMETITSSFHSMCSICQIRDETTHRQPKADNDGMLLHWSIQPAGGEHQSLQPRATSQVPMSRGTHQCNNPTGTASDTNYERDHRNRLSSHQWNRRLINWFTLWWKCKCLKGVMDIHGLSIRTESHKCYKSSNPPLNDIIFSLHRPRIANTLNVNTCISNFHHVIACSPKPHTSRNGKAWLRCGSISC